MLIWKLNSEKKQKTILKKISLTQISDPSLMKTNSYNSRTRDEFQLNLTIET